jgi:predicted ATPase/DNA-binding SARP family transcriptional activator
LQVGLEIAVLGELATLRGKTPLPLPASRKTRALLGYLAVTRRAHSREELCDLLWQGPDDPRAALRWSLTKLRGVLGAEAIRADRERIALGDVETDLSRASALVKHGELEQAARCFRGELLEGLSLPDCYRFHEWATSERDRARALRIEILTALVEQFRSEPERALGWARQRVAIDPLVEDAHVIVIGLCAQLGRKRDALQQFETCARILDRELGLRPSPALLDAKRRASASDRTLEVTREDAPVRGAVVPALFGREREYELIERAMSGESAPLLVFVGEPGIGKSRLLDELANATRDTSGVVLGGRAFEAEMVRAYGPWLDAFAGLDDAHLPPSSRADLAPLLPAFRGDDHPTQDRSGLFAACVRLIEKLAESQRVSIVLDDLQWFDEASVALLSYVVRSLGSRRVVIACAARPGELSENASALSLVRRLVAEGRALHASVGPLSQTAIGELARSVAPNVDAERVARDSSGNPLFALELTRAFERGDDRASDSVVGLIHERISRFDEPTKELLAWAAALGHRFDLGLLERVTGVPPLELGTRIAELERHGIVRASDDGNAYDFVHDLVRNGAYRQLSEPRRRGVHRNIARALDALDGSDAERASDVAHHASLGGDSELAVRACRAAANRCLRMFAGAEAARLARAGLREIGRLPRRERITARLAFLEILVFAAPHTDQLRSDVTAAIAEAQASGSSKELARALEALSQLAYDHGDLGAAHATTLRAAEAGKALDPVAQAAHLATSARCLAVIERDLTEAEALFRQAKSLAKIAPERIREVDWADAILLAYAGESRKAIELFEQVLASARADEDRWVEYECLCSLVQLELEGDVDPTRSRAAELVHVATKIDKGSEAAIARALAALRDFQAGTQDGREAFERALTALSDADAQGMLAYTLTLAAETDLECDRSEDAERKATRALAAATVLGRPSQVVLALVALARAAWVRGDELSARARLSQAERDCGARRISARARAALTGLAQLIGV